jgi:regulator of protease activity HflC (stomatin/prohibitin superfamily)
MTGALIKNPRAATVSGAPLLNGPAFAVLVLCVFGTIAAAIAIGPDRRAGGSPPLFAGTLIGGMLLSVLIASAIRIVDQWERAIVLRLGRFVGLRGPGIFLVVPLVDRVARVVDQRIRSTDFAAETCLTKDAVPVNVDAIAFWVVWDAQKAVLEVEEYLDAVILSAQTALRDAIGKHALAELISERKEVGNELRGILDAKTHEWGVTIQSVEIRDVVIPEGLQDAMSRQAQAERERQARIILGTAETEIAAKFVEAASKYEESPIALNLRAMNMLYEGMKENTNLVIVPSSLAASLNMVNGAKIPVG